MKSYHHLSIHEREQIRLLLSQKYSLRDIARILHRNHRTIAREIKRNSPAIGSKAYCPSNAHIKSVKRRATCKTKRLDDGSLRSYVIRRLTKGWSPETISGRLRRIHSQIQVSHETIYRFIYSGYGKRERLSEFLHRGHQRRQSWKGRATQAAKRLDIPNKTNISQRPKEANLRETVGHLETDLMEGNRTTGGAVSVTVDRKSGIVILDKLSSKQTAERIGVLEAHLRKLPKAFRKTMTFDNGKENIDHQQLRDHLDIRTFFCNPYHSWEKGTVENTIGLIRSWIPKGSDLTQVTQADLNVISQELNYRPRKRHGYLTPAEVLLREINWGT